MPERQDEEQAKEWGSQGGKARAAKMSPAERKQSARRASQARWAKRDIEPTVTIQTERPEQPDSITLVITNKPGEFFGLSEEGETCSVNSRSSVITPSKTESFTQ